MADRLFIGAMSGTSADGVDAALIRIAGHGLEMTAQLVGHYQHPYNPEIRKSIFDMRATGKTYFASLARLARDITLNYAEAVKRVLADANIAGSRITAIAAHGQTLFHEPPLTIQWFDPSLLAWETNCPVISDLRRADCAAGGQGAPLVPFADYILFRHPTKNRILLNIGGIANLTYIPAGGSIDQLIAFDTGPGNCISDALARTYDPDGPGYDVGGERASKGHLIPAISLALLRDSYFTAPPPKSTDGPCMLALWDDAVIEAARTERTTAAFNPEDLFHTACFITAHTIADAIRELLPGSPQEIIASGGGLENQQIMKYLVMLLGTRPISEKSLAKRAFSTTAELGWLPDAKEAAAFALLGAATLDGFPSNVPAVTGAQRGVVLGSITPRP